VDQLRVFSPLPQRALHSVAEAVVYPAAERRLDRVELDPTERAPDTAENLVAPIARPLDLVWQPDDIRRVWAEEGEDRENLEALSLGAACELDPFPRAQSHAFEAQRPALAARGLAEAETELASLVRQGRRVVVAFPHRGDALRTQRLLRKVDAHVADDDAALARDRPVAFVVSPA